MATPVTRFNIEPFWGDAYKHLDYVKQPFNNPGDTSNEGGRFFIQGSRMNGGEFDEGLDEDQPF